MTNTERKRDCLIFSQQNRWCLLNVHLLIDITEKETLLAHELGACSERIGHQHLLHTETDSLAAQCIRMAGWPDMGAGSDT